MNERYYKPSGRIPIVGVVVTVAAGMACAAVLGCIYGAISFYNPFIYVNFLGALGVGFLPAIVIAKVAYWGKIRNNPFLMVLGIITGLVALYFSWVGYLFVLFVSGGVFELSLMNAVALAVSPLGVGSIILRLAENGSWSMMGYTPTGIVLYILWVVEAGIIIVINSISTTGNEEPFCEDCKVWTEARDDTPLLQKQNQFELKKNLEQENYKFLDEMLKEEADPTNCFSAIFNTCPHCKVSSYLTIIRITIKVNKEGELESNTTDVIKNLTVPHSLVETFIGKAKALEELREQQVLENKADEEEEFPK
ncbi:hypothetical protein MNBD_PLANCTO02-569 [hydrothermal vent metagenome]|uniref:Uncharacterized protein n=1 Tax=hydrothermal vent metagenome TaxID=652676 RepID=A0A3B1DYR1_9ZZZZ